MKYNTAMLTCDVLVAVIAIVSASALLIGRGVPVIIPIVATASVVADLTAVIVRKLSLR